jgi:hypothetical protein
VRVSRILVSTQHQRDIDNATLLRPDGPVGGWSYAGIGGMVLGFVIMLFGFFGWVLEPPEEPHHH